MVIHGDHFTPSSMCRFGQKAPVAAIFVSSNQIAAAPSAAARGCRPGGTLKRRVYVDVGGVRSHMVTSRRWNI